MQARVPITAIDHINVRRTLALTIAAIGLFGGAGAVFEHFHLAATGGVTQFALVMQAGAVVCLGVLFLFVMVTREKYLEQAALAAFFGASAYLLAYIGHALFVQNAPQVALHHVWWLWTPWLCLFATQPWRRSMISSGIVYLIALAMAVTYVRRHNLDPMVDPYAAQFIQFLLSTIGGLILLGGLAVYRDVEMTVRARADALEEAASLFARAAEEAETARRAAVEAQTEAEKTAQQREAFVATMSHELRTPLNAIIGFSEIIDLQAFGPISPPRYKEYAHDINSSGKHLLAVINQILDYSRIESGVYEIQKLPTHLCDLVEEVRRMMTVLAAQKNIELRGVDMHTGSCIVETDPQAIRQIIINLVSNAIKFTPAGGHVTVSVGHDDAGCIVLAVADTGIGIPPDRLNDVRLPFVQIKSHKQAGAPGTGLGLAIVSRLAASLGLQFDIASEQGRGTNCTIVFPGSATVDESEGLREQPLTA